MFDPCEGFGPGNVLVVLLCAYVVRKRMTARPGIAPGRGGRVAKAVAKQAAKKGLSELFRIIVRRR